MGTNRTSVRRSRAALGALLALAAVLIAPATTQAAPAEAEFEEFARRIVAAVDDAVAAKRISKPPVTTFAVNARPSVRRRLSTGAPAVRSALERALEKVGARVADDASIRIDVGFEDANAKETGFVSLALEAQLIDVGSGGTLGEPIRRSIHDDDFLVHVLGVTVALPPGKDATARSGLIGKALESPEATLIGGSSLQSAGDLRAAPYRIQVLVEGEARNLSLGDEDLPFISLELGETYVIRIENRSGEEAAADVRVDGVSVFAFAGGLPGGERGTPKPGAPTPVAPRPTHVLVPKRSPVDGAPGIAELSGWYLAPDREAKFEIAPVDRGVQALMGRSSSSVGTISVSLSAAWTDARPEDEPHPAMGVEVATGIGELVKRRFEFTPRRIGVTRAALSIRYRAKAK